MFFSLELNENSQIPVKKGLEQRWRQLLYILEGQNKEKIKKRKKGNIRCVYTRPSPQSFLWGNSLVWPLPGF